MADKKFMVRTVMMHPSMIEKLKKSAASNRRSMIQQILYFLHASLEKNPVLGPGLVVMQPGQEAKQLPLRMQSSLNEALIAAAAKRKFSVSKDIRDRLYLELEGDEFLDSGWSELVTTIESITTSGIATSAQIQNLKIAWQRYTNAASSK
tara:strand:- start:21044 stop:21493 length:450 start_codon:yes stop_codon:yes gene_type:complete